MALKKTLHHGGSILFVESKLELEIQNLIWIWIKEKTENKKPFLRHGPISPRPGPTTSFPQPASAYGPCWQTHGDLLLVTNNAPWIPAITARLDRTIGVIAPARHWRDEAGHHKSSTTAQPNPSPAARKLGLGPTRSDLSPPWIWAQTKSSGAVRSRLRRVCRDWVKI